MALYLYQAAYTAESVAAQIKEPQDRIEAVRGMIEGQGGKLIAGGYPFGEYDVLVMIEAPDETVMASIALSVAAGGAPPGHLSAMKMSSRHACTHECSADTIAP